MIQMIITQEDGQQVKPLPVRNVTVRQAPDAGDAPGWWVEWSGQSGASGGFSLSGTHVKSVEFKAYDPDGKAEVEPSNS